MAEGGRCHRCLLAGEVWTALGRVAGGGFPPADTRWCSAFQPGRGTLPPARAGRHPYRADWKAHL